MFPGSDQETSGNEETDGEAEESDSDESEDEGAEDSVETAEDEVQVEAEIGAQDDEYFIEDEWIDYFDRLEEMEEKKAEIKVDKMADAKISKEDEPTPNKGTKIKEEASKSAKKEKNQNEKIVPKVPAESKSRNIELEKALNEINELVDIITMGKNKHVALEEEKLSEMKEDVENKKMEKKENVPEEVQIISEDTEAEKISKTAKELFMENEALKKENGELRQELKEEEEEDDDDDDDDDDEAKPEKPEKPVVADMYKDENYPTYDVDLDVLTESFEEGSKDEWDEYFDEMENKKSPQPKMKATKEHKEKKKHVPESPAYKEGDYPHYKDDLDVLMDSFEGDALQDEWIKYFDDLEEEENKRLDGKVKKKKGRRSGGGSSFFAEAVPIKDNKTRKRHFLDREKQRREQMKHKIDNDSIKSYIKEKATGKKQDSHKETSENDNMRDNGKVEDAIKEGTEIDSDPLTSNEDSKVEGTSILQETLLKLIKDVEKLLYQNGHTNGEASDVSSTDTQPKEEPKTKETKTDKSKKLKGEMGKEKSAELKGETLDIFPQNIDLTDPDSIVNTIKHTTTVANKIMQEFADSLTEQLLNVKAARAGRADDDDDDEEAYEPWEVVEERNEKFKKLCKKGRLSSADCNQVSGILCQ